MFVQVGFDPDFQPGAIPPSLPEHPVAALIDTGATYSCIDSGLAEELGLPIIGSTLIASAHGVQAVNEHLAQIHINNLGITLYGPFDSVHLRAGNQPYDVLLGRSFLRYADMHYEGATGRVVISRQEVGTSP